jgi:hypothetical protein
MQTNNKLIDINPIIELFEKDGGRNQTLMSELWLSISGTVT